MAELNVGIGADISELTSKIEEVKKKIQSSFKDINFNGLEDAFKDLETTLRQVGAQNEIFGKNIANTKKELSAYQKAFNDLIAQGMRPTHPELLKLADEIDRLDKEIKESEKGVKTLNDSLDSLSGVIASVGFSRLVSEITNFTKAAIKAYGDMEALELGLQSVMGGAENAAIEMEKLKEVAKLPGLSFKEAVQGSVNLQSAGFSADMSRRALMAFGNALAIVGKGSAELGRVNLALTQLQNKTGGFGQDIRQLMEALPQLKTVMEKAFGTADTEVIQNLGYTGAQVVEMLIKEFEKIPQATGGINNAFENIDDTVSQSMASIGEEIATAINLKGLIDNLSSAIIYLTQSFKNLDPETKRLIIVSAGVTTAILALTSAALGIAAIIPSITAGLAAMGTTLGALTGYIGLAVIAIVGITAAILSLTKESREASARQEEFNAAMAGAEVSAKKETTALDALIAKAKDEKLSRKERIDAVNEIQRLYPNYFGSLSQEQIMVGNVSMQYKQLTSDILAASKARAAQKLLDNAVLKQTEREVELIKERNEAGVKAREAEAKASEFLKNGSKSAAETALTVAKAYRIQARDIQNQLDENNKFLEKHYGVELGLVKDNEAAKTRIEANEAKAREIQQKENADKALKASKEYRDAQKKAESEAKKQKNKEEREAKAAEKLAGRQEEFRKTMDLPKIPDSVKRQQEEDLKWQKGIMDMREKLFLNHAEAIKNAVPQLTTSYTEAQLTISEMNQKINEAFTDITSNYIGVAISDTFTAIGEAIANGGNVINAIGGALLNAFTGFLSEMGDMLIKYGTLAIVKGKLDTAIAFGGPTAIAAGIAAVAIGAALKLASGALGARAKGGFNGSGSGGVNTSTGTGANTNSYSSNAGVIQNTSSGTVVFEIEGQKLVGVLSNTLNRNKRLGGSLGIE
ncbi:tape measure protein [Elizabethkingia meningoseptica]|uniref:tape measure protein n=1 Tax=Elizabethkingia meningoseptica TaxID=238 RepID=UPI0023AFC5F3|nr:tape measure protein [Elizabethkingia meningoseptica]MDE5516387.1 tape measure protein [Elizabethkingia meningoseptica]MDN4033755.1 tape measure protein [Elizabethkingia meningoseptica]